MKHNMQSHQSCMCILGVVSICAAMFAGGCATPWRGVVRGKDGRGMEGLALRAYGPRQEKTGGRVLLAETSTAQDGSFHFQSFADGRPELLALIGPEGTGRVFVAQASQPLDLVYPVRTTVALLHDNDLHFNFNFQDQFAQNLKAARKRYENLLLLNAGDCFNRYADAWGNTNPAAYAARSRYMIDRLNMYEYDAMTLGNHDFDFVEGFTRKALERARFPILSANIDVAGEVLPPMDPYRVFRLKNDQTIAVLGLSTVNFSKPGIAARPALETAKAYSHLADSNTIFVGLTHIGYGEDVKLAKNIPEFDVIIGGHSHTLLPHAAMINDVLIAQAGGIGCKAPGYKSIDPLRPKCLGVILLELENDKVIGKTGRVITLGENSNPLQMAWMVAPTQAVLQITNPTLLDLDAIIRRGEGTNMFAWEREQARVPAGETVRLAAAMPQNGSEHIFGAAFENAKGLKSKPLLQRICVLPALENIEIDGDLSDWQGKGWHREIKETDVRLYPGRQGGTNWIGEIRAGRMADGLYLAAQVADENHQNSKTGADIWDGDAIQFAITPVDGRGIGAFAENDFLGGLALTKQGVEFFRWHGPDAQGIRKAVKHDATAKTTTYECAIPLKELGIDARTGGALAFNIVVLDDDSGQGASSWFELAPGIIFGQNPQAFPIFLVAE